MNITPTRQAIAAGAMLMASALQAPAQEEAPKAQAVPVLTENMSSEERHAALQPSDEALAQMRAGAASRAPQVAAERETAEKVLADTRDKSEGGRITMNSFFKAAALTAMLAETAPEPAGPVPRPVVDKPQDGEKTTITSDGGAFIDNNEGLIVFLKNVKVVNPEFTMTAQKEVKALMKKDATTGKSEAENRAEWEKKVAEKEAERAARKAAAEKDGTPQPDTKDSGGATPAPAPTPLPAPPEGIPKQGKPELSPEKLAELKAAKDKKKASGLGGESDISLLVATGTVLIDYKPKPEEKKEGKKEEKKRDPVKAAAHLVIYDFEKEEILLQGGSPWVVIGGKLVSVDGENSYIRVTLKDGQPVYAVTQGGSLSAEIELKDMKEKPKDGAKPNNGNKPNAPKPPNNGDKPNNR